MKAYELLMKPEAWTRGACARNKEGLEVGPGSDEAVAWDAYGALQKAYGCVNGEISGRVLKAIKRKYGGGNSILTWNDVVVKGVDEVVAVLKECDL